MTPLSIILLLPFLYLHLYPGQNTGVPSCIFSCIKAGLRGANMVQTFWYPLFRVFLYPCPVEVHLYQPYKYLQVACGVSVVMSACTSMQHECCNISLLSKDGLMLESTSIFSVHTLSNYANFSKSKEQGRW